MELLYKPDLEEAKERWRAFWAGDLVDRPIVNVWARKDGAPQVSAPPQLYVCQHGIEAHLARYDEWIETMFFGGEAIPALDPWLGTDQFAAFLGAEMTYDFALHTGWAAPRVNDWDEVLPLRLDPENQCWRFMLDFVRRAAEVGEGRYLVTTLDMHSNADALYSFRGSEGFCLDLIDEPEKAHQAMADVRAAYFLIFDGVFEAGRMPERGSIAWLNFWGDGRAAVTCSDVSCMVSLPMFREYILPAIEEEAAYLDYTLYHLDGPGALHFLDDLLAVPDIHGIQWVPGDAQPPVADWVDLLKRIQAAGKSVIVDGSPDKVKALHRELAPNKVIYQTWCSTESEAQQLLAWFVRNT